jgi:hypothetical protein
LTATPFLETEEGSGFMGAISEAELLCNALTALITPDMYDPGCLAISKVQSGVEMARSYKQTHLWPSVFTGLQVIVNRITPVHFDLGGATSHFDLLVSLGTHDGCCFSIPQLRFKFRYLPGTAVSLCGRKLAHSVQNWESGERICVAHFMKDNVHEILQVPISPFPKYSTYKSLFIQ